MPVAAQQPKQPQQPTVAGGKINREEIAAIVDKFLAGRTPAPAEVPRPAPSRPVEVEAGSMYSGPSSSGSTGEPPAPPVVAAADKSSSNGRQVVDFVSEDDVKRALLKGEKIYINAKTIITPAARDIGEPKEVFAKA